MGRQEFPWVAWTKCPGGAAARGIQENVERLDRLRSASTSCRCATPTRGALSGPPDVSYICIGAASASGDASYTARLLQASTTDAATSASVNASDTASQDEDMAMSTTCETTQRNGSGILGRFGAPNGESEITVKKLRAKLAKIATQFEKRAGVISLENCDSRLAADGSEFFPNKTQPGTGGASSRFDRHSFSRRFLKWPCENTNQVCRPALDRQHGPQKDACRLAAVADAAAVEQISDMWRCKMHRTRTGNMNSDDVWCILGKIDLSSLHCIQRHRTSRRNLGMLSIVIPVLNEMESLVGLHGELSEVAATNGYEVEMIFVNDGSTDDSWRSRFGNWHKVTRACAAFAFAAILAKPRR